MKFLAASLKLKNKEREGPGVQEWRDATQRHEAGLESNRMQGSEEKGLQSHSPSGTTAEVGGVPGICGVVEDSTERTWKSLEGWVNYKDK